MLRRPSTNFGRATKVIERLKKSDSAKVIKKESPNSAPRLTKPFSPIGCDTLLKVVSSLAMFFGYPIAATAENWLHQAICEMVMTIHGSIEAGEDVPGWPDIIPAPHQGAS